MTGGFGLPFAVSGEKLPFLYANTRRISGITRKILAVV